MLLATASLLFKFALLSVLLWAICGLVKVFWCFTNACCEIGHTASLFSMLRCILLSDDECLLNVYESFSSCLELS